MKNIEQIKKKLKKERAIFDMYNKSDTYKNLSDKGKGIYAMKLSEAWGKVLMLMWVLGK